MLGWARLLSGFVRGHPDLHVCRGKLGGLLLHSSLFQPTVLGPRFSARKVAGARSHFAILILVVL